MAGRAGNRGDAMITSHSSAEVNASRGSSAAERYEALIKDTRVSHGAFRLWHCLRSHRNLRTGQCFPGYRTIAGEIGCRQESIKGWIDDLVSAGWVKVENGGQWKTSNVYTLLDGAGNPFPSATEKRSNTRYGKPGQHATEKRSDALRKSVAQHTTTVGSSSVQKNASLGGGPGSPSPASVNGERKW